MNKQDYDVAFKILIIGDSGVGKSSILLRFDEDKFNNHFLSTIGIDFRSKIITIDETRIKLQLWDTSGQERFKSITNAYYRGASGVIIVYDVDNLESFANIHHWLDSVNLYASKNIIKILVANKIDLERKITKDMGVNLARELGMEFFEVSAKDGKQINEIFTNLAKQCLKNKLIPLETTKPLNLEKGDSRCCLIS